MTKMKKVVSVILAVLMLTGSMVISASATETNKIDLTVQSGGSTILSAAAKPDYSASVSVFKDAIIDTNSVAVNLTMTDVAGLGIEGTKSYSKTFVTGVEKEVALANYIPSFTEATLNGTIDGIAFNYNITAENTNTSYIINAIPQNTDAVRNAWAALTGHIDVCEKEVYDSYISLPGTAYIQIGTEKLVVKDTDGSLLIDGQKNSSASEIEILEVEELEDAQIEIFLPAGTAIALGHTEAQLADNATITVFGYEDSDDVNTIMSRLAECTSNEAILITLVDFILCAANAIDNSNIVLDISFSHAHKAGEWTTTTDATCDKDGVKTLFCTGCDEILAEESIPALDHEFGKWIIDRDETCTETGIKYRQCAKCHKIEIGTVKATGHSFDDGVVIAPTCADKGYTLYTCINCGETKSEDETTALEHTWGDWAQTLAPTCIADGTETKACSVCGGTEEKAIPALGHDYVPTVHEPDYENDGYTVFDCSRCDANYTETDEGSKFNGRVLGVDLGEKIVIKYGEVGEVKPDVEIGGTVTYTCEFASANDDVATVDEDGNITGMGMGKTVITCTVTDQYDNVVTDTVEVQVKFSLANWFEIIREVLKAAIEYVIGGLDFGPIKDLIGGNK